MWLERIALISFFLLLTVLTVCLQLDTPEADRKDWFLVFAPLYWLYAIVLVLILVGWGEFCCIVCALPADARADEDVLDRRRRKRRPSDAADLLASSVSLVVFVVATILLSIFLNGNGTGYGTAAVVLLIVYFVLLLLYLFVVSYYNTLRARLKRKNLSYGTCCSVAFRCGDSSNVPIEDEQFGDLSVCGDAGLGRCKCAAGCYEGTDPLTWVDSIQSLFIYVFIVGLFVTLLLVCLVVGGTMIAAGEVLIPLYIALGLLILNSFCLFYVIAARREDGYAWTTYTLYFLGLALALTFLILLAVKIDTDTISTWFYVFLPLTLALLFITIGTCTTLCCPSCRRITDGEKWGVLAREPTRAESIGLAVDEHYDGFL